MTQQKNVKKIEKRTKFIELKALQTDKICNFNFWRKNIKNVSRLSNLGKIEKLYKIEKKKKSYV